MAGETITLLQGELWFLPFGVKAFKKIRKPMSLFWWSSLWGALRLMSESTWWPDLRTQSCLEATLGSSLTWIPGLPHPSCVVIGKLLHFSETQVVWCRLGDMTAFIGGLLWDWIRSCIFPKDSWMLLDQCEFSVTWVAPKSKPPVLSCFSVWAWLSDNLCLCALSCLPHLSCKMISPLKMISALRFERHGSCCGYHAVCMCT